jgi:ATP-dependent RNA helicase RhlE
MPLFKNLGLSDSIVKAIKDQGYTTPTQVQLEAIPAILEGHDLMVGSQTGTGKTAGFTLPLLQKLSKYPKGGAPKVRALILTPTRELAAQVRENIYTYSKYLAVRSTAIYGGVNIRPQMKALRHGVDILVATPGRLLDHVEQRTVDLSNVEYFVLDEADRMLDMGFIPDIRRILDLLPETRQNLLFTATFSQKIKTLADGFLNEPKTIEIEKKNVTVDSITQTIYPVDNKRKGELLAHLIVSRKMEQVLVFTRTKHCADKLSTFLSKEGIHATAIHGDKTQGARMRALSDFKKGIVRILVATDIAARGIDIDQLAYVINYELPMVPEDYVHRIGRTGRAGNVGEAISLVSVDERKLLRDIERVLKKEIPKVLEENFAPDPSIRAEPVSRGKSGRQQRPQGRSQGRFTSSRSEGRSDRPRSDRSDRRDDSRSERPKADRTDGPKDEIRSERPRADRTDRPKRDFKSDRRDDSRSERPKRDYKSDSPRDDSRSDRPKSEGRFDRTKSDDRSDKPKSIGRYDRPRAEGRFGKPKGEGRYDRTKSEKSNTGAFEGVKVKGSYFKGPKLKSKGPDFKGSSNKTKPRDKTFKE